MGIRNRHLSILDAVLKFLVSAVIILFILYPFLSVFLRAFYSEGIWDFTSFKMFEKELYLLKNSVVSAALTSLISTVFSLSNALMIFFVSPKRRKLLLFLLMLTIVSPPFIGSLTYIELFGRNGFITKGILNLSINPYGLWGIVSMQVLSFTPLSAMVLIGFLESFDKSLIDAGRSLNASTSRILADIVIPLMLPAILVSFLLSFIRSLSDFSTPAIIGGAFNTLATESYLSIIAKGNSVRASTISVVLFVPSLLVFIAYSIFMKKQQSASKGFKMTEVKLKKSGLFYVFAFLSAFFILWILIQYSAIFISAFTDKYKGETYFTIQNIADSKVYIKDSFKRSIGYSIITGIFSSFIALVFSYYAYIRKVKYMKIIDFIANMPYIVPGTFFGLGYIFAFNKAPLLLTGTAIIVLLNLIFKQLPISIRAIQSTMTQIDKSAIHAAKDLGAHDLYVLKDVIFPLCRQGLFLSFINSFISTMTTIGSIIFLVYPNRKLVTMVLFDLVSSGKYKAASVLSCLIILVCLAVNLISYKILEKLNQTVQNKSLSAYWRRNNVS